MVDEVDPHGLYRLNGACSAATLSGASW